MLKSGGRHLTGPDALGSNSTIYSSARIEGAISSSAISTVVEWDGKGLFQPSCFLLLFCCGFCRTLLDSAERNPLSSLPSSRSEGLIIPRSLVRVQPPPPIFRKANYQGRRHASCVARRFFWSTSERCRASQQRLFAYGDSETACAKVALCSAISDSSQHMLRSVAMQLVAVCGTRSPYSGRKTKEHSAATSFHIDLIVSRIETNVALLQQTP